MAELKNRTPKSSGPPKLSEKRLAQLLTETAAAKHKELNELEVRAHSDYWQALVGVYGSARFESGLKRCIAELDFFPNVEQLEARIPGQSEEPSNQAKTYADPFCPVCHGAGFIQVQIGYTTGGNAVDPKSGAAMRCACFQDRKRLNQPVSKSFQPYSPEEWKEAEIARRSPECLAYRNKLRHLAGKPLLTLEQHLNQIDTGQFHPGKETLQYFGKEAAAGEKQ